MKSSIVVSILRLKPWEPERIKGDLLDILKSEGCPTLISPLLTVLWHQ